MQLNAFTHVNLCKCFCTEGGIIIIKAILCILRKLSYLGLVTLSLSVENAHPVQPNYFHRNGFFFFFPLNSSLNRIVLTEEMRMFKKFSWCLLLCWSWISASASPATAGSAIKPSLNLPWANSTCLMPILCMPSVMVEAPSSISILLQLELDGFVNWLSNLIVKFTSTQYCRLFPLWSSMERFGGFLCLSHRWPLRVAACKGLLWLPWAPDPFLVIAVSTF